jgi:TetR/AcrR family tetracycline transcriptional repressor
MTQVDRPALTRAALIDAALRLLDDGGLDGLSVRRVADALGVRSPALYWHIRTKQDLLDGIADRIVRAAGTGPPREGETWQDWLVRRATAYRSAMLAHRDAARVVTNARALDPETLKSFDRELAAMVERGFSPALALRSITALTFFVNGFVLQEQRDPRRPTGSDPALLSELSGQLDAGPDAPLLAGYAAGGPLGDEAFAHGLRALVAGTATALAAETDGSQPLPPVVDHPPGPVSTSRLRVRPRHCDAQAMVHATRYYEFFEDAVIDWLAEHAGGYRQLRERAGVDLVIVSSGCEYHEPARLDDDLVVECAPERLGRTSLTLGCKVRRGSTVLAVGRLTYVCVRAGAPVTLPDELRHGRGGTGVAGSA